ncbi:MAG: hypothetical protein H7Y13_11390, partial [Sphingobacteriaceae bacterium]|nr:hypothetical protein [Sphingobacteriaceae bacterium]
MGFQGYRFIVVLVIFAWNLLGGANLFGQCLPNTIKFNGGEPTYNTACGNESYQKITTKDAFGGSGQTFRWEYSFNGSPYATVVDGGNNPITSEDLDKPEITAYIKNRQVSPSGNYMIRRIITDAAPVACTEISDPVFLYYSADGTTVSGGTISGTSQVCSGANGTLTVQGHTGPVLRWEYESSPGVFTAIPGADYYQYSYANLTVTTCFRARVDDICAGVAGLDASDDYSNTFCVTVVPDPFITSPLTNTSRCEGTNVTFTIGSVNPLFSYQWFVNDVAISGATSSSLTLTSVTPTMNGNIYKVVVSGACGSPETSSAILTVNSRPLAPVVTKDGDVCADGTPKTLRASVTPANTVTGTTINWYDNLGNPITAAQVELSSTAADSRTFYAEAVNTATTCVSPRTAVTLTINPRPLAPAVTATQSICEDGTPKSLSARVLPADIQPGTTIRWYDNLGNLIPETQAVLNSTAADSRTFYAEAVNTTTTCVSPRTTVILTIYPKPLAPTVTATPPVCEDGTPKSLSARVLPADIQTGTTIRWYDNLGNLIPETQAVLNSTAADSRTFYAEAVNTFTTCVGPRTTVVLTIKPRPAAPVVTKDADVCEDGTLKTLTASVTPANTVTGTTINWYDNLGNPITA